MTTDHFQKTMKEATLFGMPLQLRTFFASLLEFIGTIDAATIWADFKWHMADDYLRQGKSPSDAEAFAYYDILDILPSSIDLRHLIPPPQAQRPQADPADLAFFKRKGDGMFAEMNGEQKRIVC